MVSQLRQLSNLLGNRCDGGGIRGRPKGDAARCTDETNPLARVKRGVGRVQNIYRLSVDFEFSVVASTSRYLKFFSF